jgi:copper transport protein
MRLRALTIVAVALVWVVLVGSPASAHAELVSTSPTAGEHRHGPPAQILLVFSERVSPVRGDVKLLDATGRTVSTTDAASVTGAPEQVSLAVPADLPSGNFLVAWRVISADTHPVGGSFAFSVGDVTGLAPVVAPPPSEQSPAVSAGYWLSRGLGYVALALAGGGLLFVALCWPAGARDRRVRRVIAAGLIAGAFITITDVVLQGLWVADLSLAHALDLGPLSNTLGSDFGQLAVARLVLLTLAGVALKFVRTVANWRARTAIAVFVACLCLTFAGSGHTRTGAVLPLAFISDTAHLMAMTLWLGGLVILLGCVLVASRQTATSDAALVLPRFSRLAALSVVVLVATGAFQTWRELRGTAIAGGSQYPRILLFKVAAFGLLVCLGAAGRAAVRRRHPTAGDSAARPRPTGRDRRERMVALALMRRSVLLELGIAACVLGLTAALVSTSPAGHNHSEVASTVHSGPFTGLLHLRDGSEVRLWIGPATTGPNQARVNVRGTGGTARDVPEVSLRLRRTGLDIAPMSVALTRTAAGQYATTGMQLPMPGTWLVEIQVRTTDIDQETISTPVPVS